MHCDRKGFIKKKDRINEFRRNLYKIAKQNLKQKNEPQSTDENILSNTLMKIM